MSSSERQSLESVLSADNSPYAKQLRNVSLIYGTYRTILPIVLLLIYLSNSGPTVLGVLNPRGFVVASVAYALFGVATIIFNAQYQQLTLKRQVQVALLLIDVLTLALLTYLSGGVVSGLALLLIVNVASASMLTQGRIGTFIAAVATLAVIFSELYLTLTINDFNAQFIQAGFLGIILFATSLYVQSVSRRALDAALLAEEQATSIVDLEKLNNEIIQRMRTGIMVVSQDSKIVTLNQAAKSLLGTLLEHAPDKTGSSYRLPEQLQEQIKLWRQNPLRQGAMLKVPGPNVSLQASFAYLDQNSESDILVFLENQSRIMQRIRQTKLASLGRLTANIAHEIRNPLGAISHAGQILQESDRLDSDEQRMLEIILNHSDRMNRIIEEVLDVSRHQDVAPAPVELDTWLADFIRQYRETNPECDDIEFSYQGERLQIRIIVSQLERVLTNLFDNGLRYSRKATGHAALKVVAGLKRGAGGRNQPYISVIDRGPALDEEAESRLFEPFHTTESGGTGLGLYISKELCEANQATLDYSATDDGTSCFTVNFSSSHPSNSE